MEIPVLSPLFKGASKNKNKKQKQFSPGGELWKPPALMLQHKKNRLLTLNTVIQDLPNYIKNGQPGHQCTSS